MITRHTSPAGAQRTAQHMRKEGLELVGYGFEFGPRGQQFVMHWGEGTRARS